MPARKTSPSLPTLVCSCPQETPGLMPAFPSLQEVCSADRQTSSQGRPPEPIPTGCGSVGLQAQESHWEKHRSSLIRTPWPCLPGTWEREIGPCLALGRAIRTQRSWSQEGPARILVIPRGELGEELTARTPRQGLPSRRMFSCFPRTPTEAAGAKGGLAGLQSLILPAPPLGLKAFKGPEL